jgi:hypothetical protein
MLSYLVARPSGDAITSWQAGQQVPLVGHRRLLNRLRCHVKRILHIPEGDDLQQSAEPIRYRWLRGRR